MPAVSLRANERSEVRALQTELRDVELRLEQIRRRLPHDFDIGAEETFIMQTAAAARLKVRVKAVEGAETLPDANGLPSPIRLHRVEISGRGEIGDLEFFLELLEKRTWRLGDLDTLRVNRESGGAVEFAAQLVLPSFAIEDVSGPGGNYVEALRRRLAKEQANLTLLESWARRSESGRMAAARALLRSIPDDAAAKVTQVRAGDQMSLRGAIVGAAARGKFEAALQDAGFGASRITIASEGACRPFSVEVLPGTVKPSVIPRSLKDFDKGLASLCKGPAARSLGSVTVRGKGTLNVRLLNADVAGAFFVLHDVTGENFIVDSNVSGRINLDLENASLQETFAAMSAAGLVVSNGPLHRVSLATGSWSPTPEQTYTGHPVSFSMQNADVRDVFCLFTQITGLGVAAPASLRGRTAIFVKDLPWDRVISDLISSVGLTYSIEGTRVILGAERPGTNVCEAVAPVSDSRFASLVLPLPSLAASDLELAGRARTGEAWKAYAYAPWRTMHSFEAGQQLFDARVRSIGPSGVAFEGESGRVFEIPFDPVQ